MAAKSDVNYSLSAPAAGGEIEAPRLPYQPRDPESYRPHIGLIACGGITKDHLAAYRSAGYRVAALCDTDLLRARRRKTEFYPDAKVYRDYHDLLKRDDLEVVDLAAHPHERAAMIEDALEAGKHVLSQKPFVLDLDFGRRMVDLADRKGVKLAVNQNGRWAPHFSYIHQAIRAGLLGEVMAVHASVHWDHSWVEGTEFERIRHLILYDFAIHWFDIVSYFLESDSGLPAVVCPQWLGRSGLAVPAERGREGPKGDQPPRPRARRVYASISRSPVQEVRPPLLAQVMIEYDSAQASLVFDAHTRFGPRDQTYVVGSRGTIQSTGPDLKHQTVTLFTAEGHATPELEGCWFPDGFHGTMAELLCAIEEGREPLNSARNNLTSLALCFAAAASAERHQPVIPGTVRRLGVGD